jgi:hypothetical protein
MPLVLSLPGLLARHAFPPLRSLARLIAIARAPSREPDGIAAALAPIYGVRRQTDWPLAPIRLAALGRDPGDAYWLAADPVTLVAGRDDVRLDDAVRDLSADDAQSLVATLNAHFDADGIAFVAPRPDAWFVRVASPPALATRSLDSVRGRTLRTLLPDGADARTWRRWQNELQMLLFEHPVNVARERDGKPPANSVWFEGGGTMPVRDAADAPTSIRTWTDDATVGALAVFAGSAAQPLPGSLDPVLADAAHDETLVVALDAPIDIDHIERAFAAPALAALERGAQDAVTIVADGAHTALVWRAQRPSMWSRVAIRLAKPDVASLVHAQQAGDDA